jgi:hypothetical protein
MQRISAWRSASSRQSVIGMLVAVVVFVVAAASAPGSSGSPIVGADDTVPSQIANSGAPATPELVAGELVGGASRFVPIPPTRALDTRSSSSYARMFGGSSISLDPISGTGVAAAAGVDPDDVTAVVVNTTIVRADGRGFATMWPTGSERPTAATNNTEFEGHTIGNLVIAPLGLERKISIFASTDVHVTVDVLAVFVSSGTTSEGRFEQLGPIRHTDTRDTNDPMAANERRRFDLTTAGVPADATGVVMNLTGFRSNGPGFYRVWAAGAPEPDTANVNLIGAGFAAGNQVISPVTDGQVDVFTNVGSDITIDVTGYFTGPSAASTTDGLFVPLAPGRLLDSREPGGPTGLTGGARLAGAVAFELPVAGRIGVPNGEAMAVALNITGNQTGGRGFVKASAAGAPEPATSSLNFTAAGQTVPNHAITSIDPTSGAVDLLPSVDTHLIVDASGYFLADGAPAPPPSAFGKSVDPGSFVPAPLGEPPAAGPYDFLFDRSRYLSTGVRPNPTIASRYDACAPIRYALNVDIADDAAIADLITSIEEVERYTGIDFDYAGVTSAGMVIDDEILLPEAFSPMLPYRYLPPGADVVIGYSQSSDTPGLRGGVIGVGGGLRVPSSSLMFRGFAIIDLPDLPMSSERIATTTHELGHLMGLGHVSDFDPRTGLPSDRFQGLGPIAGQWNASDLLEQLMYPQLNPSTTTFSPGDIRGLWELYGTQTCAARGTLETHTSTPNDVPDEIDWRDVEIVVET